MRSARTLHTTCHFRKGRFPLPFPGDCLIWLSRAETCPKLLDYSLCIPRIRAAAISDGRAHQLYIRVLQGVQRVPQSTPSTQSGTRCSVFPQMSQVMYSSSIHHSYVETS